MVEPEASRTLEECLARIRQLEEENAHLREAAKTFGDLAERLEECPGRGVAGRDERAAPVGQRPADDVADRPDRTGRAGQITPRLLL